MLHHGGVGVRTHFHRLMRRLFNHAMITPKEDTHSQMVIKSVIYYGPKMELQTSKSGPAKISSNTMLVLHRTNRRISRT